MKKTPFLRLFCLLLLLIINFLISNNLFANPHKTKLSSASLVITKESLQANIQTINSRQGVDDSTQAKVIKLYQSALDNLNNIEIFKVRTEVFKQTIKQAPEQTKKLLKEIEQIQPKLDREKIENFEGITTEELTQRLIIEKEKISNLDEQLKKLSNEQALQNSRPSLIRQETLAAQQDIDASQKKLEMPDITPNSQLEVEAEQIYLKTLMDARTTELKMLDIEAISNPARVELLKAQIQLLEIQKSVLIPGMMAIENLLTERRQQEAKDAQDALTRAENDLFGKHPAIQATTRENIQYSKDLQSVTAKTDSYNEQKDRLVAQAAEIDSDFKSAEKKISLAGLSPALGKILREQRRNLVTKNQLSELSETLQNETALTSLAEFKVEDNLKKLTDVDAVLHDIITTQVSHDLPEDQRMMIQAQLRVLLNTQKELLNKLSVADNNYLRTLGDFDFARQQIIIHSGQFAAYLDQRLLWVPSSEPITDEFPADLYHSIVWLLSPVNWFSVVKDSVKATLKWPFLTFSALSSLGILLLGRTYLKQQLIISYDRVGKIHTDHFYYTLIALLCSLILILPIPLLLYYWGWFLTTNFQASDFSKAMGTGCQSAAIPLLFLQFFYRIFAPTGIARKHFLWQKDNTELLHRQIGWLRIVAVISVFLINSTGASKIAMHSDSIGRLALIVSMIAMLIFLRRILNPTQGLLTHTITQHPNGWLSKLRYLWYPIILLLPLLIIGFAIAGYYQSALELQQKLIITVRLLFLVIFIHEMVFRWLTLVNRQLAIENAKQKRKAVAQNEKHHASLGSSEDPVLPINEQLIDIPKINAQTIKLLNVFISFTLIIGCWMIWQNILPAFSFLDHIVLWQHEVIINELKSTQPITLTNLILAGLFIFFTVVSVLNFSGLMELLIFRHMEIETGSRYAFNQLAKYLLIAIGFIAVANELGGSWNEVQWLVAALGVGLGFGLQEIFANLVSGIILLFERPIRIGDTVTIGEITGKVSRIQMRATTIIDWDQKELIVPNKTFITSQLVNWTLSDAITRIVIPVGIAYGSDVQLAHKVMMHTISNTPMVLSDPEPCVLFMDFGESSLNFSIRVFVSEMGNRLPVIHDIHIRLEKALRENNITIPFPQRDLHIRSTTTAANPI